MDGSLILSRSSCQGTAIRVCAHGAPEMTLSDPYRGSGIHSTVMGPDDNCSLGRWVERTEKSLRRGIAPEDSTPGALTSSRSSDAQIGKEFCAQSCPCCCHRNECQYFCFTNEYLGTLIISRTRIVEIQQCNHHLCARNPVSRFSLLYYSYRGAWIPSLAFKLSNPGRLHISLSFPRVLPPDCEFFQCIRNGDLVRIKELFSSGEATAADIQAPHGLTTLTLAMTYGQDEVTPAPDIRRRASDPSQYQLGSQRRL